MCWNDLLSSPGGSQAAIAADTETESSVRGRLRNLARAMHRGDQAAVRRERAILERAGLSESQVTVGTQLVHPDPEVRRELARGLPRLDAFLQKTVIDELLRDDDEDVRAALLQSLQKMPPAPRLLGRLRAMAAEDPSPRVRGYARLLAADWSDISSQPRDFPPREATPIRPAAGDSLDASRPVRDQPFQGWSDAGNRPPPVAGSNSFPGPQATLRSAPPFPASGEAPATGESLFRPVSPYWADEGEQPFDPAQAFAEAANSNVIVPASGELPQPELPPLPPAVGGPSGFGTGAAARGIENLIDTEVRPGILQPRDPFAPEEDGEEPLERQPNDYLSLVHEPGPLLNWDSGAPLGFAGPSGVKPTESQQNSHFVPVEDRWRLGFPEWDRYGKGHPPVDDYPFVEGHWWDPYNQNVLKGDYPIIGQHTFLKITGISLMLHEFREVPTPTTPFESTKRPGQERFFGDPFQYFYNHDFRLQVDLFHGNTAFKPLDWQARVTPVVNINHLDVDELAIVDPDVRLGSHRTRTDVTIDEWFIEAKLADLSPNYDFASVRAGSQLFVSDFRGFIFSDINRSVRLFGTRFSNRDQFNVIWFDQTEKETNSMLNTFDDRHQNTFIANYFRQDFIFPGYTAQLSFHHNLDGPSFEFDRNNFLVRPDPSGVFQQHEVEAYYFGIAGDGHIGRFNLTNAFYWVTGRDSLNPIASRGVDINAQMAAVELSYDRDWVRFRTSFLWASGDDDPNDDKAEGFDAIFSNPNFAGGEFSYWQRQAVRLFGVNLVQRQSLVPNLRSSKTQGQSNFVNPGLWLANAGMDFEVTPKLRFVTNANFMWFDSTRTLEVFTFQDRIEPEIGTDLSLGMEYRPFHNDNVQIIAGTAWLLPGDGFDDLFGKSEFTLANAPKVDAGNMFSHFLELILIY